MTSRSTRRLFVWVLVLLPVQYALVGIIEHYTVREPWPVLVLPAFQSTGAPDGSAATTQITLEAVFGEDERERVPVRALLAGLPPSQHLGFFRTQCQPASLSGTVRTERCRHPDAAAWLRDRLAALHPGRTPRRLDVVWSRLRYTPAEASPSSRSVTHTTLLDTLTLRW